jgi:hypothetical protein
MRWRYVPALSLAALGGCVTAASEDQKTAAQRASIECMMRAANSLDDGISDALSVAVAVRGACKVEERRSVEVAGAGMTFPAYQGFQRNIEPYLMQSATTIVMEQRKRRRQ